VRWIYKPFSASSRGYRVNKLEYVCKVAQKEQKAIFKYPGFYRWQLPIGSIVPIAIIVVTSVALYKQGISLAGVLIICFCGYVMIYGSIVQRKRVRGFKELQIDNNRILAIYISHVIEITWENVAKVSVKESRRGSAARIISKDNLAEIAIDSELRNYDHLIEMLQKYTEFTARWDQ
jgi:hypothetical protein